MISGGNRILMELDVSAHFCCIKQVCVFIEYNHEVHQGLIEPG